MRFGRKEVVEATLMLSAAGVLVETFRHHLFEGASPPARPDQREIEPPHGAAVVAVQFIHIVGQSFANMQVFKLSYYRSAPGRDLIEAYLGGVKDDLQLRAVPVGPESMSRDQRRVLATLLVGSDPRAWEASPEFRRQFEATGRGDPSQRH